MPWCLIHAWSYFYDHDAHCMVRRCSKCQIVEKV